MNKKSFVIISILVFVFALNLTATGLQTENSTQERVKNQKSVFQATPRPVVKTYQLKHIKPEELINAARLFIIDATAHKNTVSVEILNSNVRKFEEVLKKIDVEKRDILFKIYLIEADQKENKANPPIKDANLKKVLKEFENLWNFKSYKVDGQSFLIVKESSGPEVIHLVSSYLMNLEITNVLVRDETAGNRIISIENMKLWGTQNFTEIKFIETYNKTLKEKGFLVAGISGFGSSKALILVISAEVKEKTEKEVFQ